MAKIKVSGNNAIEFKQRSQTFALKNYNRREEWASWTFDTETLDLELKSRRPNFNGPPGYKEWFENVNFSEAGQLNKQVSIWHLYNTGRRIDLNLVWIYSEKDIEANERRARDRWAIKYLSIDYNITNVRKAKIFEEELTKYWDRDNFHSEQENISSKEIFISQTSLTYLNKLVE